MALGVKGFSVNLQSFINTVTWCRKLSFHFHDQIPLYWLLPRKFTV